MRLRHFDRLPLKSMTVDLIASTTLLKFWQTDPAAVAMRDTVLSPGKLKFRNAASLGDIRGREHCQAGSAQRLFPFKPSVNQ